MLAASDARVEKEAASRAAYQAGDLSLDRNNLRPVLADLGVQLHHASGIRWRLIPCTTASAACSCAEAPRRARTSSPTTCPPTRRSATTCCCASWAAPIPRRSTGSAARIPLTSKVAIVSLSAEPDVDVDYLFLQIGVDQPSVSDAQTCGNLLAGIGAVRRRARPRHARGRNAPRCASACATPGRSPRRPSPRRAAGSTTTARCPRSHRDRRRSRNRRRRSTSRWRAPTTPLLLPTGNVVDELDGRRVTLIDNGMPVVLLRADEFGIRGDESPSDARGERGPRGCARARPPRSRPADGSRRCGRRHGAEDAPALASAGAAARSRPGPSFRTAYTPRSACSWRHPSRRASASPARSAPTWRTRPTTGRSRSSTRAARSPRTSSVGRSDDGVWRATSTSVRTARKIFDGVVFPRPRL